MRVIIAGSRSITDFQLIETYINDLHLPITEIISGTANGVDKLGEQYAKKYDIPIKHYPANWTLYGKSAGYKRNVEMANNADHLICIWDGVSKGTKHMLDIVKQKGLHYNVLQLK